MTIIGTPLAGSTGQRWAGGRQQGWPTLSCPPCPRPQSFFTSPTQTPKSTSQGHLWPPAMFIETGKPRPPEAQASPPSLPQPPGSTTGQTGGWMRQGATTTGWGPSECTYQQTLLEEQQVPLVENCVRAVQRGQGAQLLTEHHGAHRPDPHAGWLKAPVT